MSDGGSVASSEPEPASQPAAAEPREGPYARAGAIAAVVAALVAGAAVILPTARPFVGAGLTGLAAGIAMSWVWYARASGRSGQRAPNFPRVSSGLIALFGIATLVAPAILPVPESPASAGPVPHSATAGSAPAVSPAGSPTFTASPSAGPSAAGTPAPTGLPYMADWSTGMGGWNGSKEWSAANGVLASDGTGDGAAMTVSAPPLFAGTPNLEVEADIQVVRTIPNVCSFGLVVRAGADGTGYGVGVALQVPNISSDAVIWTSEYFPNRIANAAFTPGSNWHHYAVKLTGDSIIEEIDGNVALTATDNRYHTGGRIGLWSSRMQINIKNLKVSAL